jgi:hypothetical protein
MMVDVSTIDWAGLVVALFAILGVIGNFLRTSGRTKYLTAITDILDLMLDFVQWGQMMACSLNGQPCDQAAFQAKGKEITDEINKVKADLGM